MRCGRRLHDAGTTVLLVTHEVDEAEALCDRVVVMRAGRVLDAGTPAELVKRYAPTATLRFTLPASAAVQPSQPMALLDELRQLDGVRELARAGADVTVCGDRRIIAYVGASLVRHALVPDDLDVRMPTLEDAVITLLDPGTDETAAADAASGELVGGRR